MDLSLPLLAFGSTFPLKESRCKTTSVKAIFCGTPEIAVPSLLALHEVATVVGVVCQPDRPRGRGMRTAPPAVKAAALELGLDVFQPQKVRDGALAAWMEEKQADLALVIAYGRILDARCLRAPKLGCVNLHASLLPKYRGAAPIQRAIMNGERESGVCLMQMDEGMDTGPVLARYSLEIGDDETAGSLGVKMGALAAEVTRREIPRAWSGLLVPTEQRHEEATYAPPLTKEDTLVDFTRSAVEVRNLVRGLSPRPGVTSVLQRKGEVDRGLKLLQVRLTEGEGLLPPGKVELSAGALIVGTGTVPLEIVEAQVEGKRALSGQDLRNGRVLRPGDHLSGRDPSLKSP